MKTASWRSHCRPVATLALIVLATACTGALKPTQFTNPDFDFGFVERVAVIPLENHSEDRQAGVRASRILITELLASGAVDVVEPGQVQSALDRIPSTGRAAPNTAELVDLGETLGVQAIFVGSVEQSEILRSGTTQIPAVTLDLHMVETETGATVWASTHSEKGGGLSAKLLGTGAEPISETTRRCVRVLLRTLVQ